MIFTICDFLHPDIAIIGIYFHIAMASFRSTAPPGGNFLIQSLSCYQYNFNGNISQCVTVFYTKDSRCSDRYAAGLQCEGK